MTEDRKGKVMKYFKRVQIHSLTVRRRAIAIYPYLTFNTATATAIRNEIDIGVT